MNVNVTCATVYNTHEYEYPIKMRNLHFVYDIYSNSDVSLGKSIGNEYIFEMCLCHNIVYTKNTTDKKLCYTRTMQMDLKQYGIGNLLFVFVCNCA